MALLIFFSLLAVFVSFLCSLLESVILSTSPAYIAVQVKHGKKSGHILSNLKKNIDRPLAAILTLNTIANTIGAAGVGAQVQVVFGHEYLAVAFGGLTFTILVFSEIIPKTLGASHWKALAPYCAYLIEVIIKISLPFVLLSELLSRLLSRKIALSVTREEMIMTAEIGAKQGTIKVNESFIIKNLLLLNKISVVDIMTPRSVVMAFNKNLTVKEVMTEFRPIRYSRIPVYNKNFDDIEGMVHRYKLMEASSNDHHNKKIGDLMTSIQNIKENVSVARALDRFIKTKRHMFIVVDEYGTNIGLVTLEDTIETLLGVEIVDELDSVADLRQYALEKWKERKNKKT